IHNTFPLPSQSPDCSRSNPQLLRFFWFSQTIGPGRGLEQAVTAIGRAAVGAELTLVGRPHASFVDDLRALARTSAPRLRIEHRAPLPPDALIDAARGHDI